MIPAKNLPLLMNLSYFGFNRSDFQPIKNSDGSVKTFCNIFIQYVCSGLGYTDFTGKVANEIVKFMDNPTNGWITVGDEVAQSHANQGVLVLAGSYNPTGHGHVCLVVPGLLEKSSSFGKSVPKCVNVGESVFFGKKISFAFTPQMNFSYYALAGMI